MYAVWAKLMVIFNIVKLVLYDNDSHRHRFTVLNKDILRLYVQICKLLISIYACATSIIQIMLKIIVICSNA